MFGGGSSIKLGTILGIRIGVNASWFFVLFLFIFLLNQSFERTLDSSSTVAFVTACLAALLFFGSIVLHELGHALAARRRGIEVAGIDLFFFGGVMKMSRDTDSPGAEFVVAAAGPAVTLVICAFGTALGVALAGGEGFWDAARLGSEADASLPTVLVSFLVTLNAGLFLFNMIPAFPLDGGRLARAAVWKVTGSRTKATRVSAGVGQLFAYAIVLLGLYLALARDEVFNGLWLAVLGWMLGQSARAAVVHTAVTQRLEGITIADVMDADPVTIPAELTAARAYDEYFLRYHGWPWFAVVEPDGRFAGLAHRAAVETAALREGGAMPVRDVVARADTDATSVRADLPLEALLGNQPLREHGALMAVDAAGHLRGVVTVEMVSRALATRLGA